MPKIHVGGACVGSESAVSHPFLPPARAQDTNAVEICEALPEPIDSCDLGSSHLVVSTGSEHGGKDLWWAVEEGSYRYILTTHTYYVHLGGTTHAYDSYLGRTGMRGS